MNQLMENGHKPVPLPDKDIDDLPRGVLDEDSEWSSSLYHRVDVYD